MRAAGAALAAVAVAGVLAASLVYGVSERELHRVYDVGETVAPPARGVSLERGRVLVAVAQCQTCHGSDLGGALIGDDPWLGRLFAPNLTPGVGGIGARSDADLARSIRRGVRADGRALLMMPSHYLRRLPDEDLAAILAHLRSLAPIDRAGPPRRVGPLTRVLIATGRIPDVLPAAWMEATPADPAPRPEATAAYGAHLASIAGCKLCHHDDLRGGRHPLALPEEPTPPDLSRGGALRGWTEADFLRALRSGVTPEGRALDPAYMPWPALGQLSDMELRALWSYLRSLPAA